MTARHTSALAVCPVHGQVLLVRAIQDLDGRLVDTWTPEAGQMTRGVYVNQPKDNKTPNQADKFPQFILKNPCNAGEILMVNKNHLKVQVVATARKDRKRYAKKYIV